MCNNLQITIISSLYKCDDYIDNYIATLSKLKNLENNYLIIWNVFDTNSGETNQKINSFCNNKNYINLLNITKDNDTRLYDSWNKMLDMVKTQLVCNYNADDKLHPDFLDVYINEFKNNKDLNLLCCPLYISKSLNDNFELDTLPLMYHQKKFFIREVDYCKIINNFEPEFVDYEYKKSLLLECLNLDLNIKTKTLWINYKNNIDIFDFFRIDENNFIDINNYNLFTFPGCAPVWKIDLFKKYGGFNENEYGIAADIELWLRYFVNEGCFQILNKSYIIYYSNINSYGHKNIDNKNEMHKKKIIKKYHPIFQLINTKFDVIVPYRDREDELKLFIERFNKTHEIYFKYNIMICEQNNNSNFSRSIMINEGIKYSKSEYILITDVDLLFNKIHLSLMYLNNSKLYGIVNNNLSTGGGSFLINKNDILKTNGLSNKYIGWGSEDMDFTYRLHFNNIELSRNNMTDRDTNNTNIIEEIKNVSPPCKVIYGNNNNNMLIQQIINYNLIFYYENQAKFKFEEDEIYYNNILFYTGSYNTTTNQLQSGKLYDLVSSNNQYLSTFIKKQNVIIYEGLFLNGLPTGSGLAFNLWEGINKDLTGYWLNGYLIFKTDISEHNKYKDNINHQSDILKYYKHLELLNSSDFKLYKTYVYEGLKETIYSYKETNDSKDNIILLKIDLNHTTKFNNLHSSKNINLIYKFMDDNCNFNFKSILNNDKICIKDLNNFKLYYYDKNWQYPVITEKHVFDLYKTGSIPNNYFAFPWATLIDQINTNKTTNLMDIVFDIKLEHDVCFTVCQHIGFRRLLPLFKKICITHVFASHCCNNDYVLEEKYNIKIIPFCLYPVNYCISNEDIINKKFLCSFSGAFEKLYYLDDIRLKLKILSEKDDCYIKINDKWNFHDIVFTLQIHSDKTINKCVIEDELQKNKIAYDELLKNSVFSLCPSGTGANTIRFWESLSYGSIPVLLSNEYKLPLNKSINWNDICVLYNDKDITNLYDYLKSITQEKINVMSLNCKNTFNNFFNPDNFNKLIDIYFIVKII